MNESTYEGRYWFPKPYADRVQRLRVPAGFLLVALFAWLSRPEPSSLLAGVPVSLLGLWLRGWAAGHLRKDRVLARWGPYAYVRNPLYLGTLLVAVGLVTAAREPLLAAVFALVFGLVYLPVIELEEQHLRELFLEYPQFAAEVPKLWPRLTPAVRGGSFDWKLYSRNGEYNALLGYLAGLAWLLWKAGLLVR